ncbi:N-acetylglucosamine kinase [Arsukibacterium sp.]|uniref:N-acetylglucosamine kinase n=1 Tax=Arsukibacterium sp. TaxID=1977258 RepID=UPI00299D4DDD|nr:BadF/BadG/BcrA/BcrD ATPase family protein [Arsukibacterium sp.]MDX1537583.1 BadF/BadG/BcrA/BcrD ATPase family protein [Arsukibacterium sp.]
MTTEVLTQQPLYLGVDGGGSKCRVVLMTADNKLLGEGLSGPGNPLRGMQLATASILDATAQALTSAGLPQSTMSQLIVGAGLAGVNLPEYYQLFSAWQHPFASLHLTSDLHIACIGAHNGQDGAVLICGTGSCGLAAVKGQLLEVGGHGFPYGDNGSGAWFGLQVLQQVLRSLDKLIEPTILTELLQTEVPFSNTLQLVSHFMNASPTDYAGLAPLVFLAAEQGDSVARQIVEQGAGHINAIAERLMTIQPAALCLIGGLAYKVEPYLTSAVRQLVVPASQPPEYGAVWFARQAAANRIATGTI